MSSTSRVVGTVEIYFALPGNPSHIVDKCEVNVYPASPGWKNVCRQIIDRHRAEGYEPQVVLPIYYTGVAKRHTYAQRLWDRGQKPGSWVPTDCCSLSLSSGVPYAQPVSEEDFDLGKELDEIKARVEEELPHQPVAMGFVKSNTGAYPKSYKVESGSEPGKFYEVTLFSTDVGQCQCKGFSYRRRCSHLSVARARDEAGLTE